MRPFRRGPTPGPWAVLATVLLTVSALLPGIGGVPSGSADGLPADPGPIPWSDGDGAHGYHGRAQTSFDRSGTVVGAIAMASAVLADLDNDGDLDLAQGGPLSPLPCNVCVFENDGSPWGSSWPLGIVGLVTGTADVLVAADFDRDGDLDLASSGDGDNTLRLWGNPLDGALDPFGAPWSFSLGGVATDDLTALAAADLDRDGDVDLVTSDLGGEVRIWQNPAESGVDPLTVAWASRIVSPAGGSATDLGVGDLDGDGDVDVAFLRSGPNQVVGLENPRMDPADPFSSPWASGVLFTDPFPPSSMDVGDVDNDGDLDLVVGHGFPDWGLIAFLNPSDPGIDPFGLEWGPTFVSFGPSQAVSVGDVDNDGFLDAADAFGDLGMGTQLWIHENPQAIPGFWITAPIDRTAAGSAHNVTLLGDLDRDGDLDLVAGGFGLPTRIFENRLVHRDMPLTYGNMVGMVPGEINDVEPADVDGDGDEDIVAGVGAPGGIGPVLVAFNNTEPWQFTGWTQVVLGMGVGEVGSLAVADLDRDGDLDVVGAMTPGDLRIWENPSESTHPFAAPWSGGMGVPIDASPSMGYGDVTVADLDRDGDLDVAVVAIGLAGMEIYAFRNPSAEGGSPWLGLWSETVVSALAPSLVDLTSLDAGDLDLDGHVDLVSGEGDGLSGVSRVRTWQNPNATGMSPWTGPWGSGLGVPQFDFVNGWARIALADLDVDGDPDVPLVTRNGTTLYALRNPNDPMTPGSEPFVPFAWGVTALGIVSSGNLREIVAGDLDRDGDPDVLTGAEFRAPWGANLTVWTNPRTEGTDPWAAPWATEAYPFANSLGEVNTVAVADLDRTNRSGMNKGGDGDVLLAHAGTPFVTLMQNLGSQALGQVFPTSMPPADRPILQGTPQALLLAVEVTHLGLLADNDTELSRWSFSITDRGLPLSAAQIADLVDAFYVHRDGDGDRTWGGAATDPLASAAVTVSAGRVTFAFQESTADPDVIVPSDGSALFFLVVDIDPSGASASPNAFNVTFDPDGYGPGDWNELEHEDEDAVLTVRESPATVAGRFLITASGDAVPPEVHNVLLNGALAQTYGLSAVPPLVLTGTLDDTATGGSDIFSANYTVGPFAWPGTSMAAADGAFDSPVEDVTATVPSPAMAGSWSLCVYGRDASFNANTTATACADLTILDDVEPSIAPVTLDGLASRTILVGTASVVFDATLDDAGRGDGTIANASYDASWGAAGPMAAVDGAYDEVSEDATVTLATATLGVGNYTVCAFGADAAGNVNGTAPCATLRVTAVLDAEPPEIRNVRLNGAASQTYGLSSVPALVLRADVDDTATGGSDVLSANYTVGAFAWPGTAMAASDGAFDSPAEAVEATLVNPGVPGTWDLCVYARDDVPNDNVTSTACATLTLVDDLAPVVTGVTLNSLASLAIPQGTPSVTLNATVDDALTGGGTIANASYAASWSAAGPMAAVDGAYDEVSEDATVALSTSSLAPGVYAVCAFGSDEAGNDGGPTCASLTVTAVDAQPPALTGVLLDGFATRTVTLGTASVALAARLDDTGRGGSTIANASYAAAWSAAGPMAAVDGAFDEVTEDVAATLATGALGVGTYRVCAFGADAAGNVNRTAPCATLQIAASADTQPPEIRNVAVAPATVYLSAVPATVTLTATVDDGSTGGSLVAAANFTRGTAVWPSTPMSAQDGVFDEVLEAVVASLAPPTAVGAHALCVYASDSSGNGNTTGACAVLTIVDNLPPEVRDVALSATSGPSGTAVTLTATVSDANRGGSDVSSARFAVTGTSLAGALGASDGAFDAATEGVEGTIDTSGLAPGTYEVCVFGTDAPGNENTTGACAALTITETPIPDPGAEFPWWLLLLLLAVVVFLILAFLLRRRKKDEGAEQEPPGQGPQEPVPPVEGAAPPAGREEPPRDGV